MSLRRSAGILVIVLALVTSLSCRNKEEAGSGRRTGKLHVVTSLFPVYDFARAVGGLHAEVTLLLPPGTEPHSFEPRPADMITLSNADIFIYTNRYMEPWVGDIARSVATGRLLIVDGSRGVDFFEKTDGDRADEAGTWGPVRTAGKKVDPHIWLDFGNAQLMVETIRDAFIIKDPHNRDAYRKNAEDYRKKLDALDRKYREAFSHCRKNTIVDGGHYTFGYLARRYGLTYIAAYGFSPDAEPTARDLARISGILRKEGLKYLFHEELLSPRVAGTIARETGASLLRLHGAHNISRDELRKGTTFVELMEKNLDQLMTGLQCR